MASIRIVVVDDHEVARRGIRSVLTGNQDCEIVAEVSDGRDALKKIQETQPDIILLDISLPGISGLDISRGIHKVSPGSRVIFVSQHDSMVLAKDALKAGAAAYVVKSDAGRDLLAAIEAAQAGKTFVSRSLSVRGLSAS